MLKLLPVVMAAALLALTAAHAAQDRATPDPDAVRFRTELRKAAQERPNYAGRMIVTTWRCGTDCNVVAIIDARTGKVYFGPVAEISVRYRIDSRLLVVNSSEDLKEWFGEDIPDWVKTQYFVWHDAKTGHAK